MILCISPTIWNLFLTVRRFEFQISTVIFSKSFWSCAFSTMLRLVQKLVVGSWCSCARNGFRWFRAWILIQIGYKTLAVTATHATWPFLMASVIGITPIGTINTQYTKILALNQPPHAHIWIILNKYIRNYYTKSSKTVTRAATPRPNHQLLSQSEHSAESTRSKTFRKNDSWDLKFKSSTHQK